MPTSLTYRRFIVFSGKRNWCNTKAKRLLTPIDAAKKIWVGDAGISHKHVSNLLGQEVDAVVYDAFSGLDLDAFAAVSGSIVAGGALILLCPDFKDWPIFTDPLNGRWAPFPLTKADITGLTQARWVRILKNHPTVERITADNKVEPKPIITQSVTRPLNQPLTESQSTAVDAIIRVVTGQRRRPAVITADRGRGKSAALGMAIAQLAKSSLIKHVAVVGGQSQSLSTLFKHARAGLKLEIGEESTVINYKNICIEQIAIDELLRHTNGYSLVVVDEAATIGLPRLNSLIQTHSRLVFATTVQGYEGSGKGFHLKFKQSLSQYSRGARFTHLTQPIRWTKNDPLETLCERLLLLNGELSTLSPPLCAEVSYQKISPQTLLKDEVMLGEIMALLVAAHYQTTPNDVRYLLDGPKHVLYVQKHDSTVTGVVWISLEGGFDAEMAELVCLGERRPRGHLVAEVLAAHMGLSSAAQSNIARVQRIAVHPQLQRTGLGAALLDYVESDVSNSCDLMASSFAADIEVLPFWQQAEYSLVRISNQKNAASGQYSAIVLKSLNQIGNMVVAEATEKFSEQFIAQLSTSLHYLSWPLISEIISAFTPPNHPTLPLPQLKDLQYFAYGTRPFESTLSALRALSLVTLGDRKMEVLIRKVMQNQPWEYVSQQLNLRGRKSVEDRLREEVRTVIDI